jgi:hypothetical protein
VRHIFTSAQGIGVVGLTGCPSGDVFLAHWHFGEVRRPEPVPVYQGGLLAFRHQYLSHPFTQAFTW